MKNKALIILLLLSQFAIAQNKPAVKIISSTVQDWIGGAKGMSGTTYSIKIRILSSKPVEFKTLWLGKQSVQFDLQTYFKDPNKKPGEGDSILLVYVKRNNANNEVKESKPLPVKYRGEALIEYVVAGKPKYLTVKNFGKLKIMKGV